MNVLIVKLGATGDVVRTTPLLKRLTGHITWLTAAKNTVLLEGVMERLRCLVEQRDQARDRKYDLVINLEDTLEVGDYLKALETGQLFGAFVNARAACATPTIPAAGLTSASSVLMGRKRRTG